MSGRREVPLSFILDATELIPLPEHCVDRYRSANFNTASDVINQVIRGRIKLVQDNLRHMVDSGFLVVRKPKVGEIHYRLG